MPSGRSTPTRSPLRSECHLHIESSPILIKLGNVHSGHGRGRQQHRDRAYTSSSLTLQSELAADGPPVSRMASELPDNVDLRPPWLPEPAIVSVSHAGESSWNPLTHH